MIKRFLLPLSISLIFLLLFFRFVPADKLMESFSGISSGNFLLAFFFYTVSQVIRSIRWKPLIRELNFLDIYLINSANIFLNNVLPARTGEISWFYYSKKLGVSLRLSTWSFILGRLFDLSAILTIALVVYSAVKGSLIVFLVSSAVLFLSIFSYKAYLFIPSYRKLKDLKNYIRQSMNLKLSLYLLLCSLLSVIFKFLAIASLLTMPFNFLSFLSFSFGELSTVLPVHSFMGYGTYELSFSIPAKLASKDLKEWLIEGFIAHNFLLLSSALYGIVAIFLLHRKVQ